MRDSLAIHTKSVKTHSNDARSFSSLIRIEAPADEVKALFDALSAIRGVHRVEVRWNCGSVIDSEYVDSDWRSVYVRGTDRAVHGAKNMIMLSGLREANSNADHDHARCIAHAQRQGVPASYAHMVETYLSM